MSLFDAKDIQPYSSSELWRSIPTCFPTKSLFWPDQLSSSEQDLARALADATGGIDAAEANKDRWYLYGENEKVEFCFDAVEIPVTRFSDGSYPAWYGASDQDTSKAEVTFHLCRQAVKELAYAKDESSIQFERAFCLAHVRTKKCLDIRKRSKASPSAFLENGPPYPHCNKMGHAAQGIADTILNLSRRYDGGEVVGVFEKDIVLSSIVKAYWDAKIDKVGTIRICGAEAHFEDGWMVYSSSG